MSNRLAWAVAGLGVVLAAGCGVNAPNTPCTPMSGPSPLVTGAQLLRLDVYAAGTACAGNIVAPGAGAPLLSHSFKPGEKISLQIPNGPHTVVLTTFSDAAGAIELGSVCQTVTIQPGGSLCLDLTVAPAPDLGPPDAAMDLGTCTGAQCACSHDGDCREASRPRCSPGGLCVPCVPTGDNCPARQYCTPSFMCSSGCKGDSDCAGSSETADGGAPDGGTPSATPFCNTTRHSCVQCLSANDCPTGQLCSPSGACVLGCDLTMGKGCPGTLTCCNKLCVDTRSDPLNCSACGMPCTGASTQCCNSVCSDPNSDALNCGGCGKPCSTVNATPHCGAGGVCSWTCSSTFAHCAAGNTGCETSITTTAHCGACATSCANPNGTTTCTFNGSSGGCVPSCDSTHSVCGGNPNSGCLVPLTTTANCGACSTTCANPNGTTSCTFNGTTGGCSPSCDSTHGLCGGNPNLGCLTALTTTSNCGACGTMCQQVGGTNACTFNGSTGGCVPSCDSTHGVCGGNPNSGCLVPLTTTAHCGACATICVNPNGTTSCTWNGTTGGCTPSCDSTHGVCGGNPNSGCLVDITTSTANCGGCGRACSNLNVATPACSGGLCTSTCTSPFGNCSTPAFPTADDGCETNLNTNTSNCGQCGRGCSAFNVATLSCSAGLCNSTCAGVNANCSLPAAPAPDNGCECAGNICCGTGCPTARSTGISAPATYYDCGAKGTIDVASARDACAAYAGAANCDIFSCNMPAGPGDVVCNDLGALGCDCWAFANSTNGVAGHVHTNATAGACFCPGAGDPTWN